MNWKTAAKLNRAKHASRHWRRDGRPSRYVMLWDSKDYNKAQCIGKVDPKTMEAVTALGLWEHSYPEFHDYSDTAQEHWWLVEDVEVAEVAKSGN